jgi:hypothetical protein
MRPDFKLSDEHLEKAKEMVLENRKKNNCRYCYDRGFVGYSEENMLIICYRCVDDEKVMEAWKAYVKGIPELWEEFQEDFEKEEEERKEAKAASGQG